MAASAAGASVEVEIPEADISLDQGIGGGVSVTGADFGYCAICLDKIALQETALVKGCEHAYCVTCILRWASYRENQPLCPQCKHPFEFLNVHRSLDGSVHDYMFEESVCLLLRASWFVPVIVEPLLETMEEPEEFYQEDYEQEADDYDEAYYIRNSSSANIRIGNRRWGDNGYVRAGRKEARPVMNSNRQFSSYASGAGSSGSSKEAATSKAVVGRRAKRAQRREAAEKEAAEEKHQQLRCI